ncbi:alkane 1-monooxygenase [Planktotalea arctica]|uniref:alkane 1-monooxygenase n=1 Tax=Planktotalea arctica TaxID=1481893 RepID=UPI003219B858
MFKFIAATFGIVFLLLAGALIGGAWVWAALIYITLFAYGIDRLTPEALGNSDPEAEFPSSNALNVTLAFAHFIVLGTVLFALTQSMLPVSQKLALFLATALFVGQIGHPNAHELIHRPQRALRRLGRAVYMSILMGHHASAHPLVHHVHVGTAEDPVSAPKGRGFWRFFGRAWIGSYRKGYAAEAKRLKPGAQHPYLSYHLGAAATLLAGFAIGGAAGVVLIALLGLYAQLQIFLSDYVQHYGLRRKMLENGKPEPVGPQHSWNTPHRFSGAMMLNAPRHSDHHTHPARAYPALQLVAAQMPMLPYSLPMMAVIALIPPLWRRVMDPRVAEWENQT